MRSLESLIREIHPGGSIRLGQSGLARARDGGGGTSPTAGFPRAPQNSQSTGAKKGPSSPNTGSHPSSWVLTSTGPAPGRLHPLTPPLPQIPPLVAQALPGPAPPRAPSLPPSPGQALPAPHPAPSPFLRPARPSPGSCLHLAPPRAPPSPGSARDPPVRALTAAGLAVAQAALLQHPLAAAAFNARRGQAGARPRLQASPAVPRALAPQGPQLPAAWWGPEGRGQGQGQRAAVSFGE